jgi:tetratricopeptide (TPR) repeat protein
MPDSTWIHSGSTEAPGKMDLALAWIKEHRETLIGALVILCGIIIFSLWFFFNYSQRRDAAWGSLFRAQQIGYGGNFGEATKMLDAIETNYKNTSAFGFSKLTRGDLLFRQGSFKEAAEEYAAAGTGARNLQPFSLYNRGKALEAASDLAGAQAQYKDLLAKYPDHFLAPEAHYSLARAYELAGSPLEARSAYEKIALLYPDTNWAASAKAKLNPETAKPAAEAPKPAQAARQVAKPAAAAPEAKPAPEVKKN